MAKKAGMSGYVSTGSAVSGIKSWTLDYVTDTLETTDFTAAGVKTYIIGGSGWAGAFEGYKDGAPQTEGGAVTLGLYESASAYWSGSAYITGTHASAANDGVVSVGYEFQGTGILNHTES